jgi:hypothetical protein
MGIGVKQPWREATYSPSPIADVKNKWSYISYLLYAFTACTATDLPSPFLGVTHLYRLIESAVL